MSIMLAIQNQSMPDHFPVKRTKEFKSVQKDSKSHAILVPDLVNDQILPGLPDDVSKYCLALVPRSEFPTMGAVCKRWRQFIKSKELFTVRNLAGVLEEWLYVHTVNGEGNESKWYVLDRLGHKRRPLLPMPGPVRAGFGVVVVCGKLLVIGGYSVIDGIGSVSSDVYQYDSCLNSWTKLASMNVSRYDFACAEVNGVVYAVGGCGIDGNTLSCAEMFDPDTEKWILIESMRRPRRGCFACSFKGKLYIMGGRSSFTIGNSKCIDIYSPQNKTWQQIKNGCVMVTTHAVLGEKLFCVEWKNERKLAIFDPMDNSWRRVPLPVNGSVSVGFKFGVMDGKLLLFLGHVDPSNHTLLYDPDANPGFEWRISEVKPSGLCLCSVTIKA